MPYIKRMQKAGNVIFVDKYHTYRNNDPDIGRRERRRAKYKKTTEQQQSINDRNAAQRFIEYGCENFTPGVAMFIRLGYRREEKPESPESAHDLLRKFLKKLKRKNKELKYMAVTEEGSKGGLHHHLLVENADLNELCKLWPYGEVKVVRTYTGELSQLISYLTKGELDHMLPKEDRAVQHKGVKQSLRTKSANLKKPAAAVRKVVKAQTFTEHPTSVKVDGEMYDVKVGSEYIGVTEDGYLYQRYILIRRE